MSTEQICARRIRVCGPARKSGSPASKTVKKGTIWSDSFLDGLPEKKKKALLERLLHDGSLVTRAASDIHKVELATAVELTGRPPLAATKAKKKGQPEAVPARR